MTGRRTRGRRTSRSLAVVGAGLMGVATAWHLARRGHEVTLIEAYPARRRDGRRPRHRRALLLASWTPS
ncbi:FAD-dependent oxidoreductase [Streptomyces pseudovenezuelae]